MSRESDLQIANAPTPSRWLLLEVCLAEDLWLHCACTRYKEALDPQPEEHTLVAKRGAQAHESIPQIAEKTEPRS